MLQQLTIANFAIIDRLDLALAPGLNVLTGETGAGKSIVIDAVSSLLGSRLGPEFIRTGAAQAHVEAIFDLGAEERLAELLASEDLSGDEGAIIVSRDLNKSGRSVARVNGRAVPLGTLQQVGQHLIDVHGQSEHLSLLRVAEHVDFLDGYAGTRSARAEVAKGVAALRQLRREIESLLREEAGEPAPGRHVEDALDVGRVGAGADELRAEPAAEERPDGVDDDRLTGAGLAREDVEPGC